MQSSSFFLLFGCYFVTAPLIGICLHYQIEDIFCKCNYDTSEKRQKSVCSLLCVVRFQRQTYLHNTEPKQYHSYRLYRRKYEVRQTAYRRQRIIRKHGCCKRQHYSCQSERILCNFKNFFCFSYAFCRKSHLGLFLNFPHVSIPPVQIR